MTADKDYYAIRMTNERGTWWWTGHMTEGNPSNGYPATHVFGWAEHANQAKRIPNLRAAVALAQSIDSGLRILWPVDTVRAVALRHSVVHGWVQYNEDEAA